MQCRKQAQPGACFFFTLTTHQQQKIFSHISQVNLLREAFATIKKKHPFSIDAIVILPDHIHCIWTLPINDSNYSKRWRLIKAWFVKHSTLEHAVWQNQINEHAIHDALDLKHHIEYIHYNPVKHGYAQKPITWQHSSFHKFVAEGHYLENWGQADIQLPLNVGTE